MFLPPYFFLNTARNSEVSNFFGFVIQTKSNIGLSAYAKPPLIHGVTTGKGKSAKFPHQTDPPPPPPPIDVGCLTLLFMEMRNEE